jgi:hypothetical protein
MGEFEQITPFVGANLFAKQAEGLPCDPDLGSCAALGE